MTSDTAHPTPDILKVDFFVWSTSLVLKFFTRKSEKFIQKSHNMCET